jgi:hypothetical protein
MLNKLTGKSASTFWGFFIGFRPGAWKACEWLGTKKYRPKEE